MKRSGVLGCVALVVVGLFACSQPAAAQDIDVAVLNFALNLEYLEASFYSCAAYGKPLNSSDRGGGPEPIGCTQATLTPAATKVAKEIADDEIAHVRFLRAALGNLAVPQPLIDVGPAFAAAANAAVGATLSPPFSPYIADKAFYLGAFIFEDVGVTAYKGAARLITNKDYLEAAAGILAVEAYHAGAIRALLVGQAKKQVGSYGVNVKDVALAISNLRDSVDGASDDDQGIVIDKKNINLVPADSNSIAYSRDTCQVLKIVYLGGNSTGGFYPNGLNGAIKSC